MWIHGRYFDIWRRSEGAPRRSVSRSVLLLLAVLEAGCVVTDKIEFDEPMNHPFEILSQEPVDIYLSKNKGERVDFAVTVWDPDVDEIKDIPLAGRLIATSAQWSTPLPRDSCPSGSSEGPDENGRTIYRVACRDSLPFEIQSGTLIEYTLVVSDLGFDADDASKDGANVAEMTWVIEMQ